MASFDKNIGQYLQRAFADGHAAHAYVVVGDKHQIPDLLKQCAQVCMCANHADDGCETCKKVRLGLHQDVLCFPRDTDKNRLSVADMLTLVEESYKRPVDNSDRRVFLLDATNSVVGAGAEIWQNKLLKTLEEPTDDVYIFVGVTDAEALLPTVRSRCQILKQTRFSVVEVTAALQRMGFERKYCEVAACVSGGSVETGERVLANPAITGAFCVACDLVENMTSTKNAIKYTSQLLADKENVIWCLHFLTVLFRESVVFRLAEELCILPSYTNTIDKICQNYTLQAAEVCIELVNSAKKRLDDGGNLTVVIDQLTSSILEVRYRCRI